MKYKVTFECIVDTSFDSDNENLNKLIEVISELAKDRTPMIYNLRETEPEM